jgi:hypothetical protein
MVWPWIEFQWKSLIRSRESDGYGSKGSKLVSLIFKNEAISITLIRISLSKGIWALFEGLHLFEVRLLWSIKEILSKSGFQIF